MLLDFRLLYVTMLQNIYSSRHCTSSPNSIPGARALFTKFTHNVFKYLQPERDKDRKTHAPANFTVRANDRTSECVTTPAHSDINSSLTHKHTHKCVFTQKKFQHSQGRVKLQADESSHSFVCTGLARLCSHINATAIHQAATLRNFGFQNSLIPFSRKTNATHRRNKNGRIHPESNEFISSH